MSKYGNAIPCEAGQPPEICGGPTCGAMLCKVCRKVYPHCHAHHAEIKLMMRGHVLRVHPETLPRAMLLALKNSGQAMARIRAESEGSPDLWAAFFAHMETL